MDESQGFTLDSDPVRASWGSLCRAILCTDRKDPCISMPLNCLHRLDRVGGLATGWVSCSSAT